uniref:Uncharacterized protein n=1 Tax=Globodera rostochiensis TaxID=31243 RepID=A0A914HBV1_GLORO
MENIFKFKLLNFYSLRTVANRGNTSNFGIGTATIFRGVIPSGGRPTKIIAKHRIGGLKPNPSTDVRICAELNGPNPSPPSACLNRPV